MLIKTLKTLFRRDLTRLRQEIELYTNEKTIWHIERGIANSAGNLCLHLIGNLNTYLGAELGQTGYIRHRELEFSLKDIPKAELLKQIDDTITVVDNSLDMVTESQLDEEYPLLVFDKKRRRVIFWCIWQHIWAIISAKSIITGGCSMSESGTHLPYLLRDLPIQLPTSMPAVLASKPNNIGE